MPGTVRGTVFRYFAAGLFLVLSLLAGCSIGPQVRVTISSPPEGYVVQNGTALHVLVRVTDDQDKPVDAADEVAVTLTDPAGKAVTTLPCSYRGEGTYASTPHEFPIGSAIGTWRLTAVARVGSEVSETSRSFVVEPSRAERLHVKYGFWLDDFDFFHCHGSDSFITHEVADPNEGHVLLEEHCNHPPALGDQIHIGVSWTQQAFPTEKEAALALVRVCTPPFYEVEIAATAPATFQGRAAWRTGGTFSRADEPRVRGAIEWVTFQCPGDDRVFTIVTAATKGVQDMLANELSGLRESFRCPRC